jgi:hypothetical protein
MKYRCSVLLACSLAFFQTVTAQPLPGPRPPRPFGNPAQVPASALELPLFDLDFAGGPPKALVETIQKAMGNPLNVIIPEEFAHVMIAPLKLRKVNVVQVFNALSQAGTKSERYISGYSVNPVFVGGGRNGRLTDAQNVRSAQYSIWETKYGFRTSDESPSENSIWYFYYQPPPPPATPEPEIPPARSFRCWQLGPTLESFTIEDITTAIETTWKMLGSDPLPKMSFHKETKLLIVVGTDKDLSVVNGVLEQLPGTPNQPVPRRPVSLPGKSISPAPVPSGNANPH